MLIDMYPASYHTTAAEAEVQPAGLPQLLALSNRNQYQSRQRDVSSLVMSVCGISKFARSVSTKKVLQPQSFEPRLKPAQSGENRSQYKVDLGFSVPWIHRLLANQRRPVANVQGAYSIFLVVTIMISTILSGDVVQYVEAKFDVCDSMVHFRHFKKTRAC